MESVRFEEGMSPFRAAFADARREASYALGAAADPVANTGWDGARFEARIEKRLGSRAKDTTRWNALGRDGWELVAVDGKHAFFRRAAR